MIPAIAVLAVVAAGCNQDGKSNKNGSDTARHHYIIDSTMMTEPALSQQEIDLYQKMKNLLEFHTRDSMKTDSTYIATLSMGKNISSAEMKEKVAAIVEPGGKVQVRDTSQEISFRMAATLEDKATDKDPCFLIELIGGENNIRTYDPKKNKMIWQWNVTPLKEGRHELILSISQLDSLNYEAGSPETRHHNITIFSSKKKTGFIGKIGKFLGNNWQWLIGAVGVPLLIVWLNNRNRRVARETSTPAAPSNPNWKRKGRRK